MIENKDTYTFIDKDGREITVELLDRHLSVIRVDGKKVAEVAKGLESVVLYESE